MPNLSIKTFVQLARRKPVEQSILIRGNHGVGKSAIVRQITKQLAEDTGIPYHLLDIRISQMTEGDMIGLPDKHKLESGELATKFLPPQWYMLAATQPCVLFLDEFNRGSQEIMQACFQIVLDRCMNMVPLHPQTRVFSAINVSGEYNVNTMDPALLDRLWVVDLDPDYSEWLTWARSAGINGDIVNFITENPIWLDPPKKSSIKEGAKGSAAYDPTDVQPSRRSWEMLDTSLKHMKLHNASSAEELDLVLAESAGRIGTLAAVAFINFLKKQEKITGKDIMTSYKFMTKGRGKKAESVEDDTLQRKFLEIKNIDQINGIAESVADYIEAQNWENGFDDNLAKNLEAFFADLPAETFFASYKRVAKPRQHIKLMAAINPTAGTRIAMAFKNNLVK